MIDAFGMKRSEFERAVRQTCSECGAGRLWWTSIEYLPWKVEAKDRKRVFELADWCGPGASAWYCHACGGFGAFGPSESWFGA